MCSLHNHKKAPIIMEIVVSLDGKECNLWYAKVICAYKNNGVELSRIEKYLVVILKVILIHLSYLSSKVSLCFSNDTSGD